MIRITALSLVVAFLSAYAYKDWFKSVCGLILLMAVIEHPDMPKKIMGVPGLNLFNFLIFNVVLAWLVSRGREGLKWDMPAPITGLFVIFYIIIGISVMRLLANDTNLQVYTESSGAEAFTLVGNINEYLVNSVKFIVPGLLVYDGCRSKERFRLVLLALTGLYVALALLTIRAMKLGSLFVDGEELQKRALKLISSNVGYHRVNMSMMMCGAFWLVFAMKGLLRNAEYLFLALPACFVIFLAQALTGGRTGYLTWGLLGLFFVLSRHRKYLLLVPFVLPMFAYIAPAAVDRLLQGTQFESEESREKSYIGKQSVDGASIDAVTSGRTVAWAYVIDAIEERPLVGYGRIAMRNASGVSLKMTEELGAAFSLPHPHNMYLQWILDNGYLGFIPVFILFFLILKYSLSLYRDESSEINRTVGACCISLVGAMLIAGFGSQTFYPREGSVGMWVVIGLMFRVYTDRKEAGIKPFGSLPQQPYQERTKVVDRPIKTKLASGDAPQPLYNRSGNKPAGSQASRASWRDGRNGQVLEVQPSGKALPDEEQSVAWVYEDFELLHPSGPDAKQAV